MLSGDHLFHRYCVGAGTDAQQQRSFDRTRVHTIAPPGATSAEVVLTAHCFDCYSELSCKTVLNRCVPRWRGNDHVMTPHPWLLACDLCTHLFAQDLDMQLGVDKWLLSHIQ